MTTTRQVCKTCGGARVHHTTDDDGCWCPRCIMGPFEDRCQTWEPVDVETKKTGKRSPKPTASVETDSAGREIPRPGTLKYDVWAAVTRSLDAGMTDDELERALSRSHQSVSAARNGLVKVGLLKDSGVRRLNRHGNDSTAWIINPP